MQFQTLESDPEYINLQTEMVRMQNWLIETGKRLMIVCEGRDSAGKGGAIMSFIRFINPRHYRVVALNKPTEQERGQWYFQRYIQHFPDPGEIVFFDRSWYNRAVVEPVMGFCTAEQHEQFLKQVNQLEKMWLDDGIILFKLWFSINQEEQLKRLEERRTNPLISWKLSTVDMQAQMKWDDYTKYKNKMFEKTGSDYSPWVVIQGNNKATARKEAMRHVLHHIPYTHKGITEERLEPDQEVIKVMKNF
jgi:polyphosphate kinase 2